jgi:hypothetical protein
VFRYYCLETPGLHSTRAGCFTYGLQGSTACGGSNVADPQVVRQLCENHCFGIFNWEVSDDRELVIWGYDSFEIYETRENGLADHDGNIVTHEFPLRSLAEYLEPEGEFDIQTAGFTKCRFPVLAKRCVIATVRCSTRPSVPPNRSTSSGVRPSGGAGRSSRGSSCEVIAQ